MRNLAKSLHTITALVNVAKHLDTQHAAGVSAFYYTKPADLIEHAAIVLGLSGMPDVYGLKAKAAAQLQAANAKAAIAATERVWKKPEPSPDNMSARACALAGNARS